MPEPIPEPERDRDNIEEAVASFLRSLAVVREPPAPAEFRPGDLSPGVIRQGRVAGLSWPSLDLASWQRDLVRAGLIGPSSRLHIGLPDAATVSATRQVYKLMLMMGITDPRQALALMGQLGIGGGGGRGGGGGGRRGVQVRLTNPDDIAKVGEITAQRVVGRGLSQEERGLLISQYQEEERRAAFGIVSAPDIGVKAEKILREEAPTEAGATDVARYFEAIAGMLGV